MTDLLTRLEARKKRVLRHDWYKGLKCPECGYDADRQKCAIDAGGYCRAQDQCAYDEIPDDRYIVTPDKDCADAAAEIRKLNEAIRHQAAAVADWSFVREAIMDAIANGEGELYEKYLRMAFAKHGLAVIEVPPCS